MTLLTGFDLCRAALLVEGITAPEQSVLTTLAIMANADAQCWPGIAGLVARTKLSERTVQRAVQGLKDAGHLNWVDKPGRGRIYVVHPRHSGTPSEATPVTAAPRQPDTRHSDTPVTVAPTPVTVTPKQPRTTNSHIDLREGDPVQAIADGWNDMASRTGLSRIAKLTNERRRRVHARLAEHTAADFTEAIAAVERSSFCRGDNGKGWRADFDFILQPQSFNRLIEGSYDRANSSAGGTADRQSRGGSLDGFGAALREMSAAPAPHH